MAQQAKIVLIFAAVIRGPLRGFDRKKINTIFACVIIRLPKIPIPFATPQSG